MCCCDFEPGEEVKRLPCSHLYHPACIDQWLALNKVRPLAYIGPAICPSSHCLLRGMVRPHNGTRKTGA